jgi:hypothetical protein
MCSYVFFFWLTRVNPSDPWPDHLTGSMTGSMTGSGFKTMDPCCLIHPGKSFFSFYWILSRLRLLIQNNLSWLFIFYPKTLKLIHVSCIVIIQILSNYRSKNYYYSTYLFNQNKFMNVINLIKLKPYKQTKITFVVCLINIWKYISWTLSEIKTF